MVRFERKNTPKAQNAKISLEIEKQKKSGTYNTPEVNAALQEMFCRKCYLCEQKDVGSYQIEHFLPHRENIELKFNWNNLFLSCTHCNNIKSDKYEPILDCTQIDIDKKIAFRKTGYFGVKECLEFQALDTSVETQNTTALLHEIYYGSTPQKIAEAKIIRRVLRKELSSFKECIRMYEEEEGEDKEDLFYEIKRNLKPSSPFTAFKRWIIRDHLDHYPEFRELI